TMVTNSNDIKDRISGFTTSNTKFSTWIRKKSDTRTLENQH
ncbi:6467_t:CDS:1, partial [Acaulospora morrowiae]